MWPRGIPHIDHPRILVYFSVFFFFICDTILLQTHHTMYSYFGSGSYFMRSSFFYLGFGCAMDVVGWKDVDGDPPGEGPHHHHNRSMLGKDPG